ncbi:hypothetical protein DTO021D3_8630 [Paecilomyces variotii]|nr:hypothetical protein DTO032I3_4170 [Paecilomyces variotii]KAJ9274481.1 hypothetical protein DTO021D3_8630 [Paecilomyces variotii]KAJ9347016.1 hypothetical protein DTO027B6_583 [Paecilomyces variotii]KAJ9354802.1 hypothetical protein DTO027B9_4518 [Paecilomyces variotii]KAJ9393407.1 hypothetical protein DTO032I4_178 [Paecilomyces variotii]
MADLRQASADLLTTKSRQPRWKLGRHQLSYWVDFATQVREFSRSPYVLTRVPLPDYVPLPEQPQEILIVANESGVAGRFLNNLGVEVAQICHRLSLPTFADPQAGRNYPEGCSQGEIPDFILLGQNRTTALVGEIKTPWTTDLDNLSHNDFQSVWGQIARYMDDCHCRYGVVSTYEQTVFVKRTGDYTFARSQVITASMRALDRVPPVVSAKEAMLYMAYLAGNRFGDAAYPVRIGDRLFEGLPAAQSSSRS